MPSDDDASKQAPGAAHQTNHNQITLTAEVAKHDHLQQLTHVQEDRAAEAVNHVHHWDKQEMQSGTTEQKDRTVTEGVPRAEEQDQKIGGHGT